MKNYIGILNNSARMGELRCTSFRYQKQHWQDNCIG